MHHLSEAVWQHSGRRCGKRRMIMRQTQDDHVPNARWMTFGAAKGKPHNAFLRRATRRWSCCQPHQQVRPSSPSWARRALRHNSHRSQGGGVHVLVQQRSHCGRCWTSPSHSLLIFRSSAPQLDVELRKIQHPLVSRPLQNSERNGIAAAIASGATPRVPPRGRGLLLSIAGRRQ